MKRPNGRAAAWTEIMVMTRGSVRNAKKVFKDESRMQDERPKDNTRKVHTGRHGSSPVDTIRRTSSIGDKSSYSSSTVPPFIAGERAGIYDVL